MRAVADHGARRVAGRRHLPLPRLPFETEGKAAEYVRTGDAGAVFTFRFCPVCGTTLFHTEQGREHRSVSVAVGAFADPAFPPPTVSLYDRPRHPWVALPDGIATYAQDPM